ncbi:hypothetical protein FSB08_25130 [Paraburkholderia sp. JPY432]|uniref:TnsD family Tn7-like transposition protein n=1 Tax=Paraburkholderia youngii TaxID=2782701 RepID=UPI0015959AD8|nr:TnsD family Tn7-like transposition protein [Paraburkholderia youngii]NVH75734.1 hypothetical protein [Paraburkholderia youngii]
MAIALFPLLDGETIGSNIARYGEFIGANTTLPLRRRLFGYPCKPDTRLPSGMNHLAEEARHYWNVGAKEIIRGHTEFYYATATVSEKERQTMLSDMLAQPGGRCSRRSACGWTGECVSRLRYCEECLSEWDSKVIPFYWMVDHQLPGVYSCHAHSSMLKLAKRGGLDDLTDMTVVSVKGSDDEKILAPVSPSERWAIEDVAKRSARYRASSDAIPSATAYRALIRDAGFVWPNGRVDTRSFVSSLLAYFGQEYWKLSGLNWQKMTVWLRNIIDARGPHEPSHPFMFIAAESLLNRRCTSPGSFVPTTHNRAIDLGNQSPGGAGDTVEPGLSELLCIGLLHRSDDAWKEQVREGSGWKLVCSCGLSYQASNVVQCSRTQLSVVAFGAKYQNLLRTMLTNGVSIETVSRELHIAEATLSQWARGAGCEKGMALSTAEIQHLRDRWCSLVKNARPDKRITSAYRVDSRLYRTLRRYDREWFMAFNLANRTRPKRSLLTCKGADSMNP